MVLSTSWSRAADNDPRGATRALHAAARASSTQVLAGMEATTTLTATVRAQIQTAPAADRAWLDGYGALSRGELTEAERWFSLAATAQPDEPSFEFYRGVVELELERVPSATAIFEQLVTTYPSRTPFRVALGVTHLEGKRLLHARQQLDLALQANAEDPVAHYFLARTALAQRDIGRAVEAYQAAVALEPRFMKARYELGRSFRLAGDLASAARIYRELAIDDPEPFEAHVSLANVYKYLSDRNAIQLLHERESRAPTEMTTSQWNTRLAAWDNASEHYAGLALAELAKALQLRPANVELKRQVSEVLRRTGSLERAEAYFRWLARNRPEEWLPRYRLGTILIRRAHYEDAVWQLQQAARAAPAEGDAHAALGLALLEAGDVRAAIAALELATVYSPFDPATHTNLGAAYAMTGELGRAKVSLKRSLELATFPLPRVHLTHTNLALVHLRLDERDEAMQQLQTALHAYPDYEYAKEIAAWLQTSRGDVLDTTAHDFVLNDLLERFGEVTTVVFE